MQWALAQPSRVSAVALLNTVLYPEFSPEVVHFVTALSTPGPRERATSPEGLTEIMRLGVADPAHLPNDVLAEVLAPFATTDARLALARAGIGLSPARIADNAGRLSTVDVAVRVVYGEQDRALPDVAETFARLRKDLPAADVTTLSHCGHFLQEDDPDRVGELLAEFFAEVVPMARPRAGRPDPLCTALFGADDREVAGLVDRLRPPRQSADRYAAAVNAGTVDDHIGRFRELAEAGVTEVMMRLPDLTDAEPLARMAKVIPAFRP